MGLSGSGKSTFVRCVNRLIDPTAGQVLIDGANVAEMDAAEIHGAAAHQDEHGGSRASDCSRIATSSRMLRTV